MSPARIPAYQRVANSLREEILTGVLPNGTRLPAEADLAEDFSVSRSTVREALRFLASRHLIVTTRGVKGGSFVAIPHPLELSNQMTESIDRLADADHISLAELLEARELLEVPASGLAARRRTLEDLEHLRRAIPDGQASIDNGPSESRNFHALVLKASGNRLLETLTRPMFGVIRQRYLSDAMPIGFWAGVFDDHQRILDAIRASDSLAAAHEMRRHMHSLRSAYGIVKDSPGNLANGAKLGEQD